MLSFSPPASSSFGDVERSLTTPIENNHLCLLNGKDYSNLPPRDAILAYRLYVCAVFSD
ncbi:hypothetical protein DSO57_1001582 [Entomophthora muscae]|uniref:Uncharacterized protein n=1 Tax=Entomophthora muscae TaxID=34485 RepID=A0ACC2SBK6_9FUNG|nr:hypothetical protein DSO57_1001582 [Entomophthora muscae]